ncbi:response regulator transcription factor [Faecalibacter rhinopitheci]|uniref:Response regulator transcription factor n=1 Tax=Faecalibacter rhinopitheci TaxID=2779678 RepID=A0A8J7FQ37_9FLAO|nr:response regulator transcription factor [Faecalibacter rhinopitheci]MBF0596053.1 response regulator transcription factor [Faecalibacter rhinopitheci]
MIKIAITDDHPLLLEGLKNILGNESQIEMVSCFKTVKEMMEGLASNPYDVILLDINLSDTNSIELIQPIKKLYPDLEIIMLSVHNEFAVINSCLMEGAAGYIQKNASIEEITNGIISVNNGNKYLCQQSQIIIDKNKGNNINSIPKLTRREKEILLEAATGLTTNQIAEKLFISPHTVESHRKNLIVKFQTSNLSSAIKLGIEYGLISQ